MTKEGYEQTLEELFKKFKENEVDFVLVFNVKGKVEDFENSIGHADGGNPLIKLGLLEHARNNILNNLGKGE